MKYLLPALLLLGITGTSLAQNKLCIAFYNQENLFDTIDDPHKNDNEFLPSAKKEWNTAKYVRKISNMSKVISSMNDGRLPDVVGLCEVENKTVLKDLVLDKQMVKAKYDIIHYESPDERSIDNALLYKSKTFRFIASAAYPVRFPDHPDDKTRDILMVKLQMKNKPSIVFIVNHFPSRLGGQQESEGRRFRAASVLRHICDSLLKADPEQDIVIMGDFNDEPNNRSIDSVLAAKGNMGEVDAGHPLFNAMYELKMKGQGSHYYRNEWSMLDQMIVSKALTDRKNKISYEPGSASIYKQDWMLETEEKYKGSPLRTFGGQKYLGGYSDHLPVYLYLQVK